MAMRYVVACDRCHRLHCSRCGRFVGADGDPIGYPECGRCIPDVLEFDSGEAELFDAELTDSAVLENERLRSALQRLYEDTVTPGVGCHRCAGAAGAHDEGCAMAEVEAVLGVEVPDDA